MPWHHVFYFFHLMEQRLCICNNGSADLTFLQVMNYLRELLVSLFCPLCFKYLDVHREFILKLGSMNCFFEACAKNMLDLVIKDEPMHCSSPLVIIDFLCYYLL